MKNAQQARLESDSVNQKTRIKQFNTIEKEIEDSIKKGYTTAIIYTSFLIPDVKSELESLGYTIKENIQSGINEYCTEIYW